jgi:integrase
VFHPRTVRTEDDIDYVAELVNVRRQVKIVNSRLVFALPKGRKTREVPLPRSIIAALRAHLDRFPAVPITLPWEVPGGELVTVRLIITGKTKVALDRNYANTDIWHPALESVGITPCREHGMHALRHFYASVLLDVGESIKALAKYLGHADPAFTLRTYTHLMPSSEERTKRAIDGIFDEGEPKRPDVLGTA